MLKVTADSYEDARDCPLRNVLDHVGDKWSFLVFAVLEEGPKRFNEVRRQIGDISHRVLARKLRELERDGYLSRTVHAVKPPKVVYELTPLGRSLLGPMTSFLNWALEAHPQVQRARTQFDKAPPPGDDGSNLKVP
jgi:DNA-binding HxlR family transcriptional regulator